MKLWLDQVVRPILFSVGVGLLVHAGGANWYLAAAAGVALLNVLWTIWKIGDRGE